VPSSLAGFGHTNNGRLLGLHELLHNSAIFHRRRPAVTVKITEILPFVNEVIAKQRHIVVNKKPNQRGENQMTAQKMPIPKETCTTVEKCPFLDFERSYCSAAMLRFIPDSRQLYHYCCNDDHDDCPVFLAKALRSSAPGCHSRDVAGYCEK
jgi:hypothetical protein